jgi:hypothetical protein
MAQPIVSDDDLAIFQAEAESLMEDECAIFRKTGTTTDPNTGAVVDTFATVHIGQCRVRMQSSWATDRNAGEQAITVSRYLLQVPVSVIGIEIGDLVELTASRDADLVGRRIRIDGPFGQTHSTMRRYICEEGD